MFCMRLMHPTVSEESVRWKSCSTLWYSFKVAPDFVTWIHENCYFIQGPCMTCHASLCTGSLYDSCHASLCIKFLNDYITLPGVTTTLLIYIWNFSDLLLECQSLTQLNITYYVTCFMFDLQDEYRITGSEARDRFLMWKKLTGTSWK